ncbi:MAG: TetR/AcrR family transcriptional regulator [Thermomicrobiales bacterium]|nr:TetR/AcrR family transcriptional regulator [Thermomicrobiales bacterium]
MDNDSHQPDGKTRILQEARTLFLERGFAETSMQEIADASGLTKAALYYHFRDKGELFSTMAFLEMDRIRQGLESLLTADEPLRERLTRAGLFLFESLEGDISRMMLEAFEHLCVEDHAEFAAKKSLFVHEGVVPVFAAAARDGDIRADLDSRLAATIWLGMIFDQFTSRRLGEGPPLSVADLAETIASVFLDGAGGRHR